MGEVEGDVDKAFLAGDLLRRAFDLQAAAAYPGLNEEFRIRVGAFSPLLTDPNGRGLLDESARLMFFVCLEAEDPNLRLAALARLEHAFEEKEQRADLRSMEVGANGPARPRILGVTYALAAAAFASALQETAQSPWRQRAALRYANALGELRLTPGVRPEVRAVLSGWEEALRADPGRLPDVRIGMDAPRLVQEAFERRDRAVIQRASGGSFEVVLENFLASLAYFALASDLSSRNERRRLASQLSNVPLILNEVEGLILAKE